jgi:hypothetical protein
MTDVSAAAHPGGTAGVKPTFATRQCRSEHCEMPVHIGIFFDGTGNNQDWVENTPVNWRTGLARWWNGHKPNTLTQLQRRCDSNVARLFRAYRDDPYDGYFRVYVPGIGTPFPDIGEDEPSGWGAAFGAGGDGRINFAMLSLINALHLAVYPQRPLIQPDTIKALCSHPPATINARTGEPNLPQEARLALDRVDMGTRGGLLMTAGGSSHRAAFYTERFALLENKIRMAPKPQLVEVFIDVFGFSRGAAQARAFCNWLDPFFKGSRLAGVVAHIRFLGLFDTVAAVGLGASATAFTNGHQSWGDPTFMRVPARVRHCEHYVAMHENRGAFPLEDLRVNGEMPASSFRQLRYPGMHSDVGGGYTPEDQGRPPTRADSDKLSQIPLNHMFEAAVAAKVPLDKRLAEGASQWDCFAISPALQRAYDAFVQANGAGPRPLKECLMDYLAWRVSVRDRFASLASTQRASPDDRDDLIGANRLLIEDVNTLQASLTIDTRLAAERSRFLKNDDRIEKLEAEKERIGKRLAEMSRDAPVILRQALTHRALSEAEQHLFAEYCHDSYAGFKPFDEPLVGHVDAPGTWEVEGYLRYRVRFEGANTRLAQVPRQPVETGQA